MDMDRYRERADILAAQYAAIAPGTAVRLGKRTSNLFRVRSAPPGARLEVSGFADVISIDASAGTANVGGMTTYEHLVEATLPHGYMPKVVPQLKTITLGGALTGLGIESTSYRNGLTHESVLEIDILTGAGDVVTARPDNEHRDLFFGFPNSYGTLGYALRVRIELEPVHPYVHMRHVPFSSVDDLATAARQVCDQGSYGGEAVAFVDGTVFAPGESYLTLGSWADEAPQVSDYTGRHIYYRSLQQRSDDYLTVADYLWRWDTDWFWCSRAFGVQNRALRRVLPRRMLRSNVYWKMQNVDERYHLQATLNRYRGAPALERVIQDIEVPIGRLGEFMAKFHDNVAIAPVWVCPLRQRDPAASWDLYRMDPAELYVNVGFWSKVALQPGMDQAHHNRWVEQEVDRLGGRKSLYSTAFYDEERFWQLYNGPAYRALKGRYDPGNRLLDLYAKCVRGR
jgi:FAD/FMN-containing dehydrogenase